MLTRIAGGRVLDPANGRDEIGDLWLEGERIVAAPPDGRADESFDASGCIVMAGAIDIHSHIAGANVNTARLLLPEQHRAHAARPAATPLSNAGWSTFETGRLYAADGLHHRGRARDLAASRAARASGARRHADDRQGDPRHSRQRRFRPVADARRRRAGGDPRSRRLDAAVHQGAGAEGHQCRRRRGLQGQRAAVLVR